MPGGHVDPGMSFKCAPPEVEKHTTEHEGCGAAREPSESSQYQQRRHAQSPGEKFWKTRDKTFPQWLSLEEAGPGQAEGRQSSVERREPISIPKTRCSAVAFEFGEDSEIASVIRVQVGIAPLLSLPGIKDLTRCFPERGPTMGARALPLQALEELWIAHLRFSRPSGGGLGRYQFPIRNIT